MIDKQKYSDLAIRFAALTTLDDKTAEIVRDELDPGETALAAEVVSIEAKPGVVLLTDRRVLAVWKTTLLFFFKLPTIQQFDLFQLTHVELDGRRLRLRAVADPADEDAGWEDNSFSFAGPEAASGFCSVLHATRGT
jgi:RNase P/RNase MRP subunit p29